jgi:hypothetical protein
MLQIFILWIVALAGAVALRFLSGLIEFIAAVATVIVGLLAATKTTLEIHEKISDLRQKRAARRSRVIQPTEEQVAEYGGVRYREIRRKARNMAAKRESLQPKTFVLDTTEERTDDF